MGKAASAGWKHVHEHVWCSCRSEGRAAEDLCLSARLHQLSPSLRPGGQRTGVPCVQFLLAFQIIANELSAPFSLCLIAQAMLPPAGGQRNTAFPCFKMIYYNFWAMPVTVWLEIQPLTLSLSLCFHRRPRQPHLQEGNAEEDLRRRYVSQYSVEVFLSLLNYDRYDWLQGNAAYLSFLPPYSTLITAATLVFAGALFSHTIQQVACNNKKPHLKKKVNTEPTALCLKKKNTETSCKWQ